MFCVSSFEIIEILITPQGKDQAADDIKAQFPELAKKTTFLWVGLFTSNFWSFPMMKPTEIVRPFTLSTAKGLTI